MINISKDYSKLLQTYRYQMGSILLIAIIIFLGLTKITSKSLLPSSHQVAHVATPVNILTQRDINRLLSWNLFGQSIMNVAADTTSKYEITGIIQSSDPKKTAVFMTTQGSDEQAYSLGDHLANGDRLEQIYEDRIIISHAGKLRAIMFDLKAGSGNVEMSYPASNNNYEQPKVLSSDGRYNQWFRGR